MRLVKGSPSQPLKNKRGQLVMEAVLLLVVILGVYMTVSRVASENQLMQRLISGPWTALAGMMENGVWGSPDQVRRNHPHSKSRGISNIGDQGQ